MEHAQIPHLGETGTPVTRCRQCGLDIQWVQTDEGERIPIDARAAVMDGPRFQLTADNPPIAKAMGHNHIGYGHGDHRKTCPMVMRERHPYGR